jgi:hypothetical protein
MKKEVILAISIGFALGLVITFGIWTANKSLANINNGDNPKPEIQSITASSDKQIPTVSPIANNSAVTLTLTSPEDEAFTSTNTITVSGKTTPSATVVLTYEGEEQILQADLAGNFSTTVNLIAGYNQITATSFDKSGQSSSQSITVTYSTAKI